MSFFTWKMLQNQIHQENLLRHRNLDNPNMVRCAMRYTQVELVDRIFISCGFVYNMLYIIFRLVGGDVALP